MRGLRAFCMRLLGLLRPTSRERDLSDEIEGNIALIIEEHIRAGLNPKEARRLRVNARAQSSPTSDGHVWPQPAEDAKIRNRLAAAMVKRNYNMLWKRTASLLIPNHSEDGG